MWGRKAGFYIEQAINNDCTAKLTQAVAIMFMSDVNNTSM
jgi:hypothetical protein